MLSRLFPRNSWRRPWSTAINIRATCRADNNTRQPFFRTTWTRQVQKDKLFWFLLKVTGWQWHQPDHMQVKCTSLLTDNTPALKSCHISGNIGV